MLFVIIGLALCRSCCIEQLSQFCSKMCQWNAFCWTVVNVV